MKLLNFVKFVWRGIKEKTLVPYLKYLTVIVGGKGCYDYGRYDILINHPEIINNDVNVFYVTKFQNLFLWIYNLQFVGFLKSVIYNIAVYFSLPLKIVTYTIIIILMIFLLLFCNYIYLQIKNMVLKKNNNEKYENHLKETVINNIKQNYVKYTQIEEGLKGVISEQSKKINSLESEIEILIKAYNSKKAVSGDQKIKLDKVLNEFKKK